MEYDYVKNITLDMVKERLPERHPQAHKGVFGKLLCVCGSKSMPGAAYLSILSALRCGVGLVKAAVPKSVYQVLARKIPEATFCILDENNEGTISKSSENILLNEFKICSAILIGCGLGWNEDVKHIVYNMIKYVKMPMIIDADGINVISENIDILKEAKSEIIITPHMKEMSRLIGKSIDEIKINKIKFAKELVKKYGITVTLKGHDTIIADKKENVFVNPTGNSGMAKGGSGDVLSGMIGSFLAQGLNSSDASVCGVYLHGAAGDVCKEQLSATAMLPTDIINELPNLFKQLE